MSDDLLNEARRTAIGLAGCRIQEDAAGMQGLYDDYLEEAKAQGVTRSRAWALLATASTSWVTQLVVRLSITEGVPVEQILMEMAGAEAKRVLSG